MKCIDINRVRVDKVNLLSVFQKILEDNNCEKLEISNNDIKSVISTWNLEEKVEKDISRDRENIALAISDILTKKGHKVLLFNRSNKRFVCEKIVKEIEDFKRNEIYETSYGFKVFWSPLETMMEKSKLLGSKEEFQLYNFLIFYGEPFIFHENR